MDGFCFFCNEKIKDGVICDKCEAELINYMLESKEVDYSHD